MSKNTDVLIIGSNLVNGDISDEEYELIVNDIKIEDFEADWDNKNSD